MSTGDGPQRQAAPFVRPSWGFRARWSAQYLVGEGFDDAGDLAGCSLVGAMALAGQHDLLGVRHGAGQGVEPGAEMGPNGGWRGTFSPGCLAASWLKVIVEG
jgi:hypothetical protein